MDSPHGTAPRTGVLRCVIVDDNDRFIELVCAVLARDGFDVVGAAHNSTQALRLVAELRPDVALIDLFLDHESGVDLIAKIARMGLAERVRTVLMSTCDPDDLDEVFRKSAADGYVPKPELTPEAIRAILHTDGSERP